MILAEPAPGVRGRLKSRFAHHPNIKVRSLDELAALPDGSLDLVVMNSVAQYMKPDELDKALKLIRRLLTRSGKLVLGDILRPEVGMSRDVAALVKMAGRHGFLTDALWGLARTALSDYRQLRTKIGLQRYGEAEMLAKLSAAGFSAIRADNNIGHNPWRMTFVAKRAG